MGTIVSLAERKKQAKSGSLFFDYKNEQEARCALCCEAKAMLRSLIKKNCYQAILRVPGQRDVVIPIASLRAMADFEPLIEVFMADTSLPPRILIESGRLLESEDGAWGVVRMSDQRQVLISSGLSPHLLAGVAISETTSGNWERPKFWHPDDLEHWEQEWRSQLNDDGSNSTEFRYRIHKPNSNDPYEWYRSLFRLIQSENGLFQIGVFRDRG